MKMLIQALAIGGAGFVGAVSRWLIGVGFGRFGLVFPLGTLVINVTGSFLLGWFLTVVGGRYPISDTVRLAIATGFIGTYTTFSTYMYESNSLFERGAHYLAWANLIGSVILGMVAVMLGARLGRAM